MKKVGFFLLFFLIIFLGCTPVMIEEPKHTPTSGTTIDIRNTEVLKDSLVLDGNTGIWYYRTQPFSGYALRYHANDSILEKTGFHQGRKEGIAKTWFSNGVLKTILHYEQNTLIGSYKAWWNNSVLASEATYVKGKLEGVQKKWYATGVLAKQRNLVAGRENGLQQAWLKNGKLYVNYEAKNGRIFGMRRANSCYTLKNEIIVTEK